MRYNVRVVDTTVEVLMMEVLMNRLLKSEEVLMDRLLKVEEMQEQLNISRSFAWKLIYSGEIPHVKIGRCVRVRGSDVAAFVERCRSPHR
jgi:excisionase family DNA binding protein